MVKKNRNTHSRFYFQKISEIQHDKKYNRIYQLKKELDALKAILTVIGKDNVGIIAGVSNELSELEINILDVSQTIMDGYFTMMMMLDLSTTTKAFDEVKEQLAKKGAELQVKVSIQREEIFNSMHKL